MNKVEPQPVINQLADCLHAARCAEFARKNGADAALWQTLTDDEATPLLVIALASSRDLHAEATLISSNMRILRSGGEINIAGLPQRYLPERFSEENNAAAHGAIAAILATPDMPVEAYASIVHDQWVARNRNRALPAQLVEYAELAESEKEKVRVIVRAALDVLSNRDGA